MNMINFKIPKTFEKYIDSSLLRFEQLFPSIKISIKNLDCKIESDENSEDLKAEFLSIIYREKIFYETLEIRKKIYSFTK